MLREVMDRPRDHRSFRLNVPKGSVARRLYERHGFAVESEDAVDVFVVAPVSWQIPRSWSSGTRWLTMWSA